MNQPTQPNRIRQLERLVEINHRSANLDLQSLLQAIVEIAVDLTQCEYSSILTHDEPSNTLKFIAGPWLHMPALSELRVPVNHSIAGLVYKSEEPLVIQHAELDPRIYRPMGDRLGIVTRSLLTVPVQYRGKILGVMQAVNKQIEEFNHEDIAFLQSLASHAALALTNHDLEIEAEHMRQEVTQLEQLKREFIAITSHELRTPLGLILGHATFLREMLPNDEFEPYMDAIISSAVRLKEIIESLTKVDNIESGMARVRQSPINMVDLVKEVVTSYADQAARKNIQLHTIIKEDELITEGEFDKIVVAMNNLVSNALNFTDDGGLIQISVQSIPGYIQLTIKDTGIGIPESDQEHIFERFFQVESHMTRRHGGMGLGLSVAKDMIELHGGQIWVNSKEGEGSAFSFVLPERRPDSTLEEPKTDDET